MNKKNICPVCGFIGLIEPFYKIKQGGEWKYTGSEAEICPSCGFQPGWSDTDQGYNFLSWRKKWVNEGMEYKHFDDPFRPKPQNWSPTEQLKNIPEMFMDEETKRLIENSNNGKRYT